MTVAQRASPEPFGPMGRGPRLTSRCTLRRIGLPPTLTQIADLQFFGHFAPGLTFWCSNRLTSSMRTKPPWWGRRRSSTSDLRSSPANQPIGSLACRRRQVGPDSPANIRPSISSGKGAAWHIDVDWYDQVDISRRGSRARSGPPPTVYAPSLSHTWAPHLFTAAARGLAILNVTVPATIIRSMAGSPETRRRRSDRDRTARRRPPSFRSRSRPGRRSSAKYCPSGPS